MAKVLPQEGVCGRIIVTGERAECPVCHVFLPGRFMPHTVAHGLMLKCRKCKREYEVHTLSDQRPEATSVH